MSGATSLHLFDTEAAATDESRCCARLGERRCARRSEVTISLTYCLCGDHPAGRDEWCPDGLDEPQVNFSAVCREHWIEVSDWDAFTEAVA